MRNISPHDLLKTPKRILFHYVDGTESLTPTEAFLNKIVQSLPERLDFALYKRYSIKAYYKNGFFSKNTITGVYSAILKDILLDPVPSNILRNIAIFNSMLEEGVDLIVNELAFKNKEFDITVLAREIYEIQDHPTMTGIMSKLRNKPSYNVINEVYETLKDLIFSPEMKDNRVAQIYMAETVSPKQANQCLGVRGYPSDLDSTIFNYPILSSYTDGLNDIKDLTLESRGAVTALFYSSTSIQKSEAFAKQTQLACMVVTDLIYSDCGSGEGMDWYVEPEGLNEHNEHYGGDLSGLTGQYYKFKLEDNWKLITDKSREIIGKNIILRTALSCKLKNRQHVCVACYGRAGYKIPVNHVRNGKVSFNLGLWASTQFNEPASQSLLSTKHYIISADGGSYFLVDDEAKMLKFKDGQLYLNFNPKDYKSVTLEIEKNDMRGLHRLTTQEMVASSQPSVVSRINKVVFRIIDKNNKEHVFVINTKKQSKYAVATLKFLEFIVKARYEIVNDIYKFNIRNFRYKQPIFYVPEMVFDFKKYNEQIRSRIESNKDSQGRIIKTADGLVKSLFTLFNSKLYVHVSSLAIMAYALTVRDKKENDFRLNRSVNAEITKITLIRQYRLLVTMFAHGTIKGILSPRVLGKKDRESHPLDVLFKPREVMEVLRNDE